METAVTAQGRNCILVTGDPTVFSPPFPLLSLTFCLTFALLLAGDEAPRELHGLEARAANPCCVPSEPITWVRALLDARSLVDVFHRFRSLTPETLIGVAENV